MNPQDIQPEVLFQQAMQAHQTGQLDKAENLLQQILQQLPEQDGIMAALGGIYLSQGKVQASIEILGKAIKINPNNVDAILNLGIALQNIGQAEESYQMIQQAAKLAPDRTDIQYNLANALLQKQAYTEALEILQSVIKLSPTFIAAYHNIGAIYTFQKEIPKAIQIYEQALQAVPNDMNTLLNLGNILADTGDTKRALTIYQQAIQAHPNQFLPHAVLGKFHLDNGSNQAGEASLQRAYALHPNDLNTNILLGNVYRTLGQIDEAEKFYRQALVISPGDQGAMSNLKRILSTKIPYWHFEMLADTERNDAYQKAIEKIVKPDSTILDIGTGSGLLSMMAARAGAKKIYACEMHPMLAATAKEITKANGYGETIDVFAKKSTSLEIGVEVAEPVDIIISEILDVGALGEAALPSIRHAVHNLAKPGVQLIPARLQLFGQLIEIPARSLVAPIRKISGFDLSIFEQYRIPNEYMKVNLKAEKYKVLSPALPLLEVDFYNLPIAYPDDQPRRIPLEFPIIESGMVQAVVFWFDLFLDEEIMVSSQVDGKLEHWGQALFCFTQARKMETGNTLSLTMLQSDQMIRFEMSK